jgi:hypothetical protein
VTPRRHVRLLRFVFTFVFFKQSFIRIRELCIGDSGVIDLQKISRSAIAKTVLLNQKVHAGRIRIGPPFAPKFSDLFWPKSCRLYDLLLRLFLVSTQIFAPLFRNDDAPFFARALIFKQSEVPQRRGAVEWLAKGQYFSILETKSIGLP